MGIGNCGAAVGADRGLPAFFCNDGAESACELISFFTGVVESKRGASGGAHLKVIHHGHAAVMSGANGDAFSVEKGTDVQSGDCGVFENKGDDGGLGFGSADDAKTGDFEQTLRGIMEEIVFVGGGGLEIDTVEIIDGGTEADDAFDIGGASFKFIGEFGIGGFFEADGGDHVSATLVGGHLLEEFAPAVEDADTGGAHQFVSAEGIEIGVEFLDIRGAVGDPLGTIDQRECVNRVCKFDNMFDGIDGAEGVADMIDGDEFDAIGAEHIAKSVKINFAGVVDGDNAKDGTGGFADELPGDDVGMMFQMADYNFVAEFEVGVAPTGGDEIDAGRGAAGEDDLTDIGRVDEGTDFFAGGFIGGGGALTEFMDGAMDVGVLRRVVAFDGFKDGTRLLRCGGVVEVNEGFAADYFAKDGKIGADFSHIEGGGNCF